MKFRIFYIFVLKFISRNEPSGEIVSIQSLELLEIDEISIIFFWKTDYSFWSLCKRFYALQLQNNRKFSEYKLSNLENDDIFHIVHSDEALWGIIVNLRLPLFLKVKLLFLSISVYTTLSSTSMYFSLHY